MQKIGGRQAYSAMPERSSRTVLHQLACAQEEDEAMRDGADISEKDITTLRLLTIFGGFFGAHQFYLGKPGKGLLYVFTAGLFYFGWIFDIVRCFRGNLKDCDGRAVIAKRANLPRGERTIRRVVVGTVCGTLAFIIIGSIGGCTDSADGTPVQTRVSQTEMESALKEYETVLAKFNKNGVFKVPGQAGGQATVDLGGGLTLDGIFDDEQFVEGKCKITSEAGTFEWGYANRAPDGTLSFALVDGTKYVGGYKDGKLHGQCEIVYNDGDIYIGTLSAGLKEGKGIYTFSSGAKYDGAWSTDKMNGAGTYIYPEKAEAKSIAGTFKDNAPDGYCVYTTSVGKYSTLWENRECVQVRGAEK
jgi:hypothetical protein